VKEGNARFESAPVALIAALVLGLAVLLASAPAALAAGRWTLVPQPGDGNGGQEISCLSGASCDVLGSDGEGTNTFMRFDGSRLRTLSTTYGGSEPGPWTTGLACVSTRFCLAVGALPGRGNIQLDPARVGRWDGTHWTSTSIAVDTPTAIKRTSIDTGELASIACPSRSMCLAVGGWFGVGPPKRVVEAPLAVRWNGLRWSVVPVPAQNAVLGSVACASATACVVLGSIGITGVDGAAPSRPISLRFDGGAWSQLSFAAAPGVTRLTPAAVSCPSSGACVAVGSATQTVVKAPRRHASSRAVILRLSGDTWLPTIVPVSPALARVRAARQQSLDAVSCAPGTPSRCVAVGSWTNGAASLDNSKIGGLAATLTAGHAQLTPLPVDSDPLTISCPTPRFCLAGSDSSVERFDVREASAGLVDLDRRAVH